MDIVREKNRILEEIGYLPSEAVFYSRMKVSELLKLSADLHKKDCSKQSYELSERLQLDLSRKIDELSFGNRKKVGIVCALQHEPKLIILDEPTSGLDPLMQKEFFDILRERNHAGATVFLSSHILSEIQHNCTTAAIIREGKIIRQDSVSALSKTNAKRVTVRGQFQPKAIDSMKDLRQTSDGASFLYSGDINLLISELSKAQIEDLTVAEPDLEEIFLHYYE